ncbi:hypothetical protein O181_088918 [Austropuccinia psidii MF-1]|uniref:Uncharacterized protein n=1 Tax=Austropuccinia psidii MF-1 TaxID=1389203 RepID=A0A9Q3ISC1_9BASI|nr:hypothetical protein [Austropuccinia psidii MF-1]
MLCTLCTKRGIPCICSLTTTDACDACQQAHKKFLFVVRPFQPRSQRSSHPRRPCKDSFVVNDDESIPEQKWTPGPQTGRQERFQMISPVPSSIVLSTPPVRPPSDGHFTPQPERKPSQHHEPPIPGLSPSSKPAEDVATCEPEPEVPPTQSMEEPFGKSQVHFFNSSQLFLTPPLPISSLSHYFPLDHHHQQYPIRSPPHISPSTPVPPPSTPSLDLPPIASKNPTDSSPVAKLFSFL